MFDDLRTPNSPAVQPLAPLSLGDSAREKALYDEYTAASRTTGDELDRIFVGLDGINGVEVELDEDAPKFANKDSVHQGWMNYLPEAKLAIKQDSPAKIRSYLWAKQYDASLSTYLLGYLGRSLFVVTTFEDQTVVEDGVVFELNGQFVRKTVYPWTAWNLTTTLSSEIRSSLPAMLTDHVREFAREARFRR
jgi:hypothetical protein